jgi:thiamine-phosphate pyrophosphorylase
MIRCLITDRSKLATTDELVALIARWDAAGANLVQIREKDLPARELANLTQRILAVCRNARVLVNTRVDVALACGAHGAHLPSDSPPPSAWRVIAPAGFLFSVACHSADELVAAEREGADYALFSPVFDPLSKSGYGPAQGLERLAAAARSVSMPVLALGGVTWDNAPRCVEAGAAGVAGITLFL